MMCNTVSKPIKSAKANGPIGWCIPNCIIPSIEVLDATPVSKHIIASFIIGHNILLDTNPG